VQSAPERFELRMVTRDAADYERILPTALAGLRRLLGPSAHLEHARVEAIAPAASGKFRAVVSRIGP
jgi:hypothetical protein